MATKSKGKGVTNAAMPRRQIAAGEFKAKCLGLIDEVSETGQELVITKRGKPMAKMIPFRQSQQAQSFIGRLEGIMKINGNPDDLVNPIFPGEDWDMVK